LGFLFVEEVGDFVGFGFDGVWCLSLLFCPEKWRF